MPRCGTPRTPAARHGLVLAATSCLLAVLLSACSTFAAPADPAEVRGPLKLTSSTIAWDTAPVEQSAEAAFAAPADTTRPYQNRYYYQQLSAADQANYRQMYNTLAAHAGVAYLVGPYDDHLQEIARCVFLDNPEFFYATQGGT